MTDREHTDPHVEDQDSVASSALASDDIDNVPNKYEPQGADGLSRQPTLLEKISSRVSFFNPKLQTQRLQLLKKFVSIYVLMATCILAIFSIYWGASYNRRSRLPNLKFLVVIEDDQTVDGVEPVFGNTMKQILSEAPMPSLGNWEIKNTTEFAETARRNNNTVKQEIVRQVHHQLYWASLYVTANATYNYVQAVENQDTNFNVSTLVQSDYETGRDIINMPSYVTPQLNKAQSMWLQRQSDMVGQLFNSSRQFSMTQTQILSKPVAFEMSDLIPFTNPVITAPSQVGLIYIIIITFFQVNMFGDIHQQVAQYKLKHHHYVLYRLLTSYVSYFILSLFYSLVSLAFQVDFTKAFGKSGFLVYWMCSYITMIAVGLMNEVMALVLILVFPPLLGFWLLFWVIANISPTFSPIALCAKFYRYGYAMPVHNSYELAKVIFFDTYKGQMGRNVGIIFAWIVIASVSFALMLKPFMVTMGKRAQAAAAAAAAKQAQKSQEAENA